MKMEYKQGLRDLTNDQLLDEWFAILSAQISPALTSEEKETLLKYKSMVQMEFRTRGIDV